VGVNYYWISTSIVCHFTIHVLIKFGFKEDMEVIKNNFGWSLLKRNLKTSFTDVIVITSNWFLSLFPKLDYSYIKMKIVVKLNCFAFYYKQFICSKNSQNLKLHYMISQKTIMQPIMIKKKHQILHKKCQNKANLDYRLFSTSITTPQYLQSDRKLILAE